MAADRAARVPTLDVGIGLAILGAMLVVDPVVRRARVGWVLPAALLVSPIAGVALLLAARERAPARVLVWWIDGSRREADTVYLSPLPFARAMGAA